MSVEWTQQVQKPGRLKTEWSKGAFQCKAERKDLWARCVCERWKLSPAGPGQNQSRAEPKVGEQKMPDNVGQSQKRQAGNGGETQVQAGVSSQKQPAEVQNRKNVTERRNRAQQSRSHTHTHTHREKAPPRRQPVRQMKVQNWRWRESQRGQIWQNTSFQGDEGVFPSRKPSSCDKAGLKPVPSPN